MQRQAGFTLIELVMVIVILGILSAFALPRFADLGQEARTATIQAALGAVKAASAIAHADALVSNQNTATGTVTLDGATINLVNGYPAVDDTLVGTEDILTAAQITSDDFTITSTATAVTVAAEGATGTCQIVYTEATAVGNAPAITIDTGGC